MTVKKKANSSLEETSSMKEERKEERGERREGERKETGERREERGCVKKSKLVS